MITRHNQFLSPFSTPLDNISDLNTDLRPVPLLLLNMAKLILSRDYGKCL